ncbi:Arf GTPase activating protein [Metarhizium album ARSEF 1941]|uniref:Arf GTPase activating protein n=1 Tax=Metarhizium album (strain ARSEF 1941) TaxID=1081103 RepID=A0A0B2WKQ1_METAS|nr:Arf GTPase activating protein [Metarhizium album ARSEF 1941]KHN96636.1 Arf GTPase activating protein [Metarhizium album ARSEF 1941]
MTSALSKRQQARNEKALQDLVHKVPGNNVCADCHARNPGLFNPPRLISFVVMLTDEIALAAWASWSLGVFLCMRCAAIHRKLGTHISKVKSLSMDTWSNEQVDNMRKVGNVTSNQIYNPQGRKPPVPIDADEVDSAMERFIRQKYFHNIAAKPSKPPSRGSDEGTPPPLPPKNSTKFGFRSASSIFPLTSRAKKEQRAVSSSSGGAVPSPTLPNKPSRLFGATIDYDGPDETDKKLTKLYEMGFQDSQRNSIVLKGVNGELDRAVEALVRLGEGGNQSPAPVPALREPTLRATRSMTPLNSNSVAAGLGPTLDVPQKPKLDRPTTSSTTSTNPFDMMPPAQPQTAQSTGTLHNKSPYNSTNNPFGAPSQQADLGQVFQGLHVSTSASHPVFFPPSNGVHQFQMPQQQQPYHQQHTSPSAPASPQSYQPMAFQNSMTYPQPISSLQQPMQTGYNRFFSQPSSPAPALQNLNVNTAQGGLANNPFLRSPTRIASPALIQIPEQAQSNFSESPFLSASPHPLPTSTNPFFANIQLPHQQQPQTQQLAQQTLAVQHPQQSYYQKPRHDKASIMALFNQPGQESFNPAAAGPNMKTATPSIPENQVIYTQSTQLLPSANQQPHSPSQPIPQNTNTSPYMNQASTQAVPFISNKQTSRESMNLGLDMTWTNGRHSPDAFASLSARHV